LRLQTYNAMDKKTFCKKVAIWTAAIAALIVLIVGLCFGRVIEGTLFAEVAKWIVMGAVVIGILEGLIFSSLGGILYHFWYEKRDKK